MFIPGKKRCCYKCQKRTQTCHGTCPDYADEMAENKKRLEEEIKDIKSREAIHSPAFQQRTREYLNRMK